MVIDFVKLGYRLQELFIRPNIEVVMHEVNSFATGTLLESDLPSSNGGLSSGYLSKGRKNPMLISSSFELWECNMWAYRIMFSIIIGGCDGQLPCLHNPSQRLQVFRAVVEAEKEHLHIDQGARSTRKTKKARYDNTEEWPLHLPSVICSLISAMILFSSKSAPNHSSGFDDSSIDRQLHQAIDLHFVLPQLL